MHSDPSSFNYHSHGGLTYDKNAGPLLILSDSGALSPHFSSGGGGVTALHGN
jgi:hypothetical protein